MYRSLVDVGWYSVSTTNSPLPSSLCFVKRKEDDCESLTLNVLSCSRYLTVLKDEGRNLQP